MDFDFKEAFNQAIEKAKFVKKVVVGGEDVQFPHMNLVNGILTVDSITWELGNAFLPMGVQFGASKVLIPLLFGSFTGITQITIAVMIFIHIVQGKFGQKIPAGEVRMNKADDGIIDFSKTRLLAIVSDYVIQRGVNDLTRKHVTFWKKPEILTSVVNPNPGA